MISVCNLLLYYIYAVSCYRTLYACTVFFYYITLYAYRALLYYTLYMYSTLVNYSSCMYMYSNLLCYTLYMYSRPTLLYCTLYIHGRYFSTLQFMYVQYFLTLHFTWVQYFIMLHFIHVQYFSTDLSEYRLTRMIFILVMIPLMHAYILYKLTIDSWWHSLVLRLFQILLDNAIKSLFNSYSIIHYLTHFVTLGT